jgi:hypothetical protein
VTARESMPEYGKEQGLRSSFGMAQSRCRSPMNSPNSPADALISSNYFMPSVLIRNSVPNVKPNSSEQVCLVRYPAVEVKTWPAVNLPSYM